MLVKVCNKIWDCYCFSMCLFDQLLLFISFQNERKTKSSYAWISSEWSNSWGVMRGPRRRWSNSWHFVDAKKWSHRSRLNPRQQRYRLGLEMGPSAHCRVLWPYPTSDLDSWDRVHAKNGLTRLDRTQDSRDTDWVLKWVLVHIAPFCWVSRAYINTVIVWLRPLDWYIICLVVNDGLI